MKWQKQKSLLSNFGFIDKFKVKVTDKYLFSISVVFVIGNN